METCHGQRVGRDNDSEVVRRRKCGGKEVCITGDHSGSWEVGGEES